eukprot:c19482_g1_i1 orf=49-594(+)
MAPLHAFCFLVASLLTFFLLPSFSQATDLPSSRSLSFQLHLQPPSPLNLHTSMQPLIPYLFSDQPLLHFDKISQAQTVVGSARGVYLADPAASMELRHIFCTASLQLYGEAENEAGALVVMGSLASGAVSVVGGTRDFAFARGQAKVSMAAPAGSDNLVISFDVELVHDEEEEADPIIEVA